MPKLREIREFAERNGIGVDRRLLQEIERTAYKNAAEDALGYAREAASEGRVEGVQHHLKDARKYAAKGGVEVPEALLQEIEQTANTTAHVRSLLGEDDLAAYLPNLLKSGKREPQKLVDANPDRKFEVLYSGTG